LVALVTLAYSPRIFINLSNPIFPQNYHLNKVILWLLEREHPINLFLQSAGD